MRKDGLGLMVCSYSLLMWISHFYYNIIISVVVRATKILDLEFVVRDRRLVYNVRRCRVMSLIIEVQRIIIKTEERPNESFHSCGSSEHCIMIRYNLE
jgi:hypothetical protein